MTIIIIFLNTGIPYTFNSIGERCHGLFLALDLFRLADYYRLVFRCQLGSGRSWWVRLSINLYLKT